MVVTPVTDPLLVSMIGESVGPRTRGVLHLSDIYKKLMIRLQPKRFGKPGMDMARVEAGFLFESILEEGLRRRFATYRPGELVSPEGVYMSPDGVNPELLAGEEYKATWMTCRVPKDAPDQDDERYIFLDEYGLPNIKFAHWFFQMMGYAKWLEVLDYILTVFFVNGNYNRSGKLDNGDPDPNAGPCFKRFHLTFTQQEVDENWLMLMNVAREEGLL